MRKTDVKFGFSGQKNIENDHTHQLCISKKNFVTQYYLCSHIIDSSKKSTSWSMFKTSGSWYIHISRIAKHCLELQNRPYSVHLKDQFAIKNIWRMRQSYSCPISVKSVRKLAYDCYLYCSTLSWLPIPSFSAISKLSRCHILKFRAYLLVRIL